MGVKDNMIGKFIDDYRIGGFDTQYDAGTVVEYYGSYLINGQMMGAESTFSIGQPIYDENDNLMGYLGIGLLKHLNYGSLTEKMPRIPVECWTICLPTEHCQSGKKVKTYWQYKEKCERRHR